MAYFLKLKTFNDARGILTVMDQIPFEIKRLFFIYGVDDSARGGHRHYQTLQAAICVQGSCEIINNNGEKEQKFLLDTPDNCLILDPQDWHQMQNFTKNSILLVLASTAFDPTDYIFDPY